MDDAKSSPPAATPLVFDDRTRALAWVRGLTTTALSALVVMAVIGTAMTARRFEKPCPDGTVVPMGATDFACYAHPLGFQGLAVVALAVALAALVVAFRVLAVPGLAPPAAED